MDLPNNSEIDKLLQDPAQTAINGDPAEPVAHSITCNRSDSLNKKLASNTRASGQTLAATTRASDKDEI